MLRARNPRLTAWGPIALPTRHMSTPKVSINFADKRWQLSRYSSLRSLFLSSQNYRSYVAKILRNLSVFNLFLPSLQDIWTLTISENPLTVFMYRDSVMGVGGGCGREERRDAGPLEATAPTLIESRNGNCVGTTGNREPLFSNFTIPKLIIVNNRARGRWLSLESCRTWPVAALDKWRCRHTCLVGPRRGCRHAGLGADTTRPYTHVSAPVCCVMRDVPFKTSFVLNHVQGLVNCLKQSRTYYSTLNHA
jgi:hypothetical protein